jgi:GTP-binding protein Era
VNHPPSAPAFRAGFACLAGRPNVGKSTLTNASVGAKVAITSDRPQTTRRVIRGIVHRPDAQLILVDTPGLHKPRTLLGERLDSLVRSTLAEVDVIGFCIPATDPVGPGDRFFARELENVKKTPVVVIVTKCDGVPPERVAEQLMAVSELGDWADVVPVSAVTGFQLDVLADVLVSHLPPGVPLYPDGELTDEPEQIMVAELIREAALDGVRDELPHSIAVVVEEMGPRPGRDDLTDVHAELYVERPTQKAIVIGRGSAAEGGGHPGPPPDRGAPRHPGLPRPARQDRQGLAALTRSSSAASASTTEHARDPGDLGGRQLPGPGGLAQHVVAEFLG